jgi:hypothetical protein
VLPLPSELERTGPITFSEPPSPIVPPPPRPQYSAAVSPTSTPGVPSFGPWVSDQFFPLYGSAFGTGPPGLWSIARKQERKGPRGCGVLVPAPSLVAVAGAPCLADESMRGHERKLFEKLMKVCGFRTPRFISLNPFLPGRSKPRRNSCASYILHQRMPSLELTHFAILDRLERKHGEKPKSK